MSNKMTKYLFKIGDVFSEWTVVDENYKCLTKSKSPHYLCRCSCGLTEKYVNASDLENCRSKRCNRCSLFAGKNELSGTLIANIKRGAKSRNLEYNVSTDFLYDLFIDQDKKCKLSGLDISLHRNYSQGNRDYQTASLDRIDSKIGYVEGNVQWIHRDINIMKNKYDQDYFVKICKLISNYNCS